ncbi:MAG: DUF1415 family protein [Deltaproteobacteria bacterium]|nr:DUF1415 family protein [Deltaproteobacteria bacterium]
MSNHARDDLDARLAAEAIRLFRRYQIEVVEAFDLCPWARAARTHGRVRERVVTHPDLDVEPALAAIAELAADPEVEIGIVLFPRVEVERPIFQRFVAEVRALDERRDQPDPFAMAEFHPCAPAVLEPAGAFTSFVRRTPDPTIQLVRRSALSRVRRRDDHGSGFFDLAMVHTLEVQSGPHDGVDGEASTSNDAPLHERVLDRNRETVAREGLARLDALFASLLAERDASYRRFR